MPTTLPGNPQLPQHPLGAYTDAQYEAQNATLRAEFLKKYADILRQLGYTDEGGNFIPGSLETQADQQKADLQYGQGLARQGATDAAQRRGTVFSGVRATETARAERPYVQGIAQVNTDLAGNLAELFREGAGLTDQYALGRNQLLADAASRRAAGITANPVGGVGALGQPQPNAGDALDPRNRDAFMRAVTARRRTPAPSGGSPRLGAI